MYLELAEQKAEKARFSEFGIRNPFLGSLIVAVIEYSCECWSPLFFGNTPVDVNRVLGSGLGGHKAFKYFNLGI